MAKKRKAFLHVGPAGVGDVIEPALVHHRDALVELDVTVPARTTDESFRAAVEILRAHKAWGFRRKEVEGQWSELCRRAWKGTGTVVLGQPLLAGATPEQIDLLVDGLAGFQVHVVVTAGRPGTAADLAAVCERWAAAVRRPERLHVVEAADPHAAWRALGRTAGFGTASLRLDDVPLPVGARPLSSLDEARHEIERLVRRNTSLELRLAETDRRRRGLRRRPAPVG